MRPRLVSSQVEDWHSAERVPSADAGESGVWDGLWSVLVGPLAGLTFRGTEECGVGPRLTAPRAWRYAFDPVRLRLALAASVFFRAQFEQNTRPGRAGSLHLWHWPMAFRSSYRRSFASRMTSARRSASWASSQSAHQARPMKWSRGFHRPQRAQSLVGSETIARVVYGSQTVGGFSSPYGSSGRRGRDSCCQS